MQSIAVLPRLLGSMFYFRPDSQSTQTLIEQLPVIPELYHWHNPDVITAICNKFELIDIKELVWQFSMLFEGQGKMPVPPWGSVYLDKDNLLMGNSALNYRLFLIKNGLALSTEINEPEDQFGLMLLALAHFLENDHVNAAKQHLEEHLLPWSDRYLELLSNNDISPFYANLAKVTQCFLYELKNNYQLMPVKLKLYL